MVCHKIVSALFISRQMKTNKLPTPQQFMTRVIDESTGAFEGTYSVYLFHLP